MSGSFGPSNSGAGPRAGELDSLFTAALNGNFVRKNLLGTALEYAPPPSGGGGSVTWGSITGTLSAQADLSNALTALIDNSRVSPTAGIVASKLNLTAPGPIGSTTPNTITATDLIHAARTIKTPVTTQNLTAASTVSVAGSVITVTAATSITLTSNPQVAAGVNGQEVEIVNIDSADSISFVDGNGLILGRTVTLFPGRSLRLRFLSSYGAWVDSNYSSIGLTQAVGDNSQNIATTGFIANNLRVNIPPTTQSVAITSGIDTVINFAAPNLNRGGMAGNVFTPSISGYYRLSLGVLVANPGGGHAAYSSLFAGATLVAYLNSSYGGNGGASIGVGFCQIFYLTSGTAYTFRASATANTTISGSSLSIEFISS